MTMKLEHCCLFHFLYNAAVLSSLSREKLFEDSMIFRRFEERHLVCDEGYKSGNENTLLNCVEGVWQLGNNEDLSQQCKPQCEGGGCQNGGSCVAPNSCECSPDFYGQQCQNKKCPVFNEVESGTIQKL